MSMTKIERYAKQEIIDILRDDPDGDYSEYAKILKNLDVNFTDYPGVVAYFEPAKGRIVINSSLDLDQVSVIVRHEILHYFLDHEIRLIDKLARESGIRAYEYDADDITIKDLKNKIYGNGDFNIAGDYEISNMAYTKKDKDTIRNIKLNGQVLCGLVTEDDHPEWVDMDLEHMYDELQKIRKQKEQEARNNMQDDDVITGAFADPVTFVGADGTVYGI